MRPDLPAWVSQYVGLRYRPGGVDLDGADCWGLYALVLEREFGVRLPAYPGAAWVPGADSAAIGEEARAYAALFSQVRAGEERCGDAILIRMRGAPLHLGMVVAPGWMLHSHDAADACVEAYNGVQWGRRVVGFYRAEARNG